MSLQPHTIAIYAVVKKKKGILPKPMSTGDSRNNLPKQNSGGNDKLSIKITQ